MAKANSNVDATIIGGDSLFDVAEVIGERFGRSKITIDYSELNTRLNKLRIDDGWRPANVTSIVLSKDPNSEGQQRFESMLKHAGFEPDSIYYRDAFVSLGPGRNPSEASGRPTVSLAARIAYVAGLMARYPSPHFLVVTHSFELCGPLTDLARRVPNGKIGLAYFASLLDYRWKLAGLFDGKLGIRFFDLEPYGSDLVGVDLIGRSNGHSESRTGLDRY